MARTDVSERLAADVIQTFIAALPMPVEGRPALAASRLDLFSARRFGRRASVHP
jgi:hypothetical protein